MRRAVFLLLICAGASNVVAARPPVTFNRDIAPLVWTRCAGCHRAGQAAPFSLITYEDVKRRATLIGTVTARRIMPPWKPLPGKGEFADSAVSDG